MGPQSAFAEQVDTRSAGSGHTHTHTHACSASHTQAHFACSALHTHMHTAPPHTLSTFSLAHMTILPTCTCVFSLTHRHTAGLHTRMFSLAHMQAHCVHKHTLHVWAALPRTSTRHPLGLPLQPLSPYKASLCKVRAPEAPPQRPQPCQQV